MDFYGLLNFVLGLTESLFSAHKEEYSEHERASLKQLYQAKVCIDCICLLILNYCSRFFAFDR